ncbi:MAG: glycosyl transferase-like UDP-glucuronosyltransferase [Sphingomonas bacterium]|nr:glycosyl transferase-like UDP-glucuronosyltransferase [Sphingomonas bacterium]
MARVLIGWELGANRGHAVRLAELGTSLRGAGHEVAFAVQRIDALSAGEAGGSAVWQAPVSPRMLVSGARRAEVPATGMADIIARLGMDERGIVAAMVGGWRNLFGAIRPDLVIAEYAPFLLLAARGTLPSIAVGTGFGRPPATMAQLPQLVDGTGAVDQNALLEAINEGLGMVGTVPLAALPLVFEADRALAVTYAELDPYAGERCEVLARPVPTDFAARAGAGEEIFVYCPEGMSAEAPLWRGLAASGLPVRIHPPRASDALRRALSDFGFAVEAEPIAFTAIAERSRLVVSHGGHGLVCAAMTAGLPQVVCHHDLEKYLIGQAVTRAGLGGHATSGAIDPDKFGADLVALYHDEALGQRARATGDALRRRDQPDPAATVVAAVDSLA